MKRRNKKGVSEIVGYVLLIVIAISLSLLVYTWLKAQTPKQVEKCPEGVSIAIADYACDTATKEITITFYNNGLFDIDGFILRIRNVSNGLVYDLEADGKFADGLEAGLKAGNTSVMLFDYSKYAKIAEIQIEPSVTGKKVMLCENSIIEQVLTGC